MKMQKFISIIAVLLFSLIIFTGCTSNQDQATERTQAVNVQDTDSETSLSRDGDWDDDDDKSQTSTTANVLSESKIRSIVEKHTTALKGKDLITKLDNEDGITVYEVNGATSTHKYEFEINATSGEIVSYSKELLQKNTKNNQSSNTISEEKVRSIVEKNTSALKNANLIIERDNDDGIKIYEVEGRTSTHKYEFEINAYTGDIISYDEELL